MAEFRFAHPFVFLALIPATLLLLLWIRGKWQVTPAVMRYSDTRLLANLPVGLRLRLRRLPDVLRLLAWLVLIIALARPQTGQSQEFLRGEGVDIVMTLDISGSMALPDFPPSRLEAAKMVIDDFIVGREFDRIGLVVFAETAFYQSPPTLDYRVLRARLDEIPLASELGLSNRTAIGVGIASAANMLRQSNTESRVIIMLTDGENNAGAIDPLTAAEAASALGIRIYTIGMGIPGRTSDFDEASLRAIASASGGRYYNATTLSDLERIYAQIDRLERSEFERRLFIRWEDQVDGWLLLALILLISEFILRHTVFQTIP